MKDLNKIVFYADKAGVMQKEKQRSYLCIVDAVCFMGLKYEKIPAIYQGFQNQWWNLVNKKPKEIMIVGNKQFEECVMGFRPSYRGERCIEWKKKRRDNMVGFALTHNVKAE